MGAKVPASGTAAAGMLLPMTWYCRIAWTRASLLAILAPAAPLSVALKAALEGAKMVRFGVVVKASAIAGYLPTRELSVERAAVSDRRAVSCWALAAAAERASRLRRLLGSILNE